ncbi:hypothetical protein QBC43DRAFT_290019 [Cladorrhinum sp. PSN259]|nr:hypothetical protein QBC43DRAFT_290019 [Cladorrhinum sp. PSN259]
METSSRRLLEWQAQSALVHASPTLTPHDQPDGKPTPAEAVAKQHSGQSTSAMSPRLRGKGPDSKVWELHKDRIYKLYMEENLTIDNVRKVMEEQKGFIASLTMYKRQFREWGWTKGLKVPNKSVPWTRAPKESRRKLIRSRPDLRGFYDSIPVAKPSHLTIASPTLCYSVPSLKVPPPSGGGGKGSSISTTPSCEVMRTPSKEESESTDSRTISSYGIKSPASQPPQETEVSRRRKRAVERAMRFFVDYLADLLHVNQDTEEEGDADEGHAGGNGAPRNTTADPSPSPMFTDSSSLIVGRSSSLKRSRGNDGDDPEDRGGSGKPPKKTRAETGPSCLRFACPFAKHSPWKYMQRSPCCGPGWGNVGYVKTIDQDFYPADGINEDIRTKLKSRRYHRGTLGESPLNEDEKWRQMYRICFPDVPDDQMPSPYYDGDYGPLRGMGDFDAFLLREMPPVVRQQIRDEVERYPHVADDGGARLVTFVTDLVPRLMRSMYGIYRAEISIQLDQAPAAAATVAATTSTSSSSSLLSRGRPADMHISKSNSQNNNYPTSTILTNNPTTTHLGSIFTEPVITGNTIIGSHLASSLSLPTTLGETSCPGQNTHMPVVPDNPRNNQFLFNPPSGNPFETTMTNDDDNVPSSYNRLEYAGQDVQEFIDDNDTWFPLFDHNFDFENA